MFKTVRFTMLLLLPVFLLTSDALAQGPVGRFGVGVTGAFNFPVFGMEKRFNTAESWGLLVSYVSSPRATVEFEYHRNRYDPGKIEESTFFWPQGDPANWKQYKSPLARNWMSVDAFTVNGLYHFVDRAPLDPEGLGQPVVAGPFVLYGAGFYWYSNWVKNLIFAGQPDLGAGLDDTLFLETFRDTDVSVGFHFGAGVELLINETTTLDVRGRVHTMLAELRQMDAYGVQRAYPLSYFDLGISMKYYFTKF